MSESASEEEAQPKGPVSLQVNLSVNKRFEAFSGFARALLPLYVLPREGQTKLVILTGHVYDISFLKSSTFKEYVIE